LRQLRKLEEMEIRREDAALREEQAGLQALLEDTRKQWRKIGAELKDTRKLFGPDTSWGKRRTELSEMTEIASDISVEAFVVREPITVVLSEKGWIRALKGHMTDLSDLKFKEDDHAQLIVQCETTDRLVLIGSDGRAFTLDGHKLPGGRGHGEPIRLTIDLGDIDEAVALFKFEEGAKRLLASHEGYGFVVAEPDLISQRRAGKQVMSGRVMAAPSVDGDLVAVIGQNRKLLVFPLTEMPEMARGKGVKMQAYKDGGLLDAKVFAKADGLAWEDSAGRNREVPDWSAHRGKRGSAGRLAPKGFSRSGRFSDVIG
jgi:topoisomerase-4 subunit A